jgi:small conductance mechanosensitive channel
MLSSLEKIDLERLLNSAVDAIPQVLAAVAIMFAFWLGFRLSRRPLSATLRRTGIEEKLVGLLVNNIYRYGLMAFGLVMSLAQLGINVGAALAGIGVAGIAIGLAAQDSLANSIAGFMIFWDKPFEVGDWVTTEGEYGQITDITLRSTRIRTPRNTYVVVPNKRIIDAVLENFTKHGDIRIDVSVGIAYKEDIAAARAAILKAVGELESVADDPAPDVVVQALGNSSVDLLARVWISDGKEYQATRYAVIEACKYALNAAGIEIPFPHLQLFWDDVDPRVVERLRALKDDRRDAGGAS